MTNEILVVRNSDFEDPQSQFRNYFSVRDYAIDSVVRNITELRK